MGIYVVKQGDTGVDIAKAQGVTSAQLFAANPGVNWDSLPVGYHLYVPGSNTTEYTIIAGDNGRAIAGRLGISFEVLENLNPGTKWTNLQIGKTLKVPAYPSLLKESIGAPISGVPAQMPRPGLGQGISMPEATRKKVTELLGASEDHTAALDKVYGMDWVACFALILSYASAQTKPLAVVDLRDPNNCKSNDQSIHLE
jgi:LysM repeat protein